MVESWASGSTIPSFHDSVITSCRMAPRYIRLTIAYDGHDYHGWQVQPGMTTIQGVLNDALRRLLGPKARICGASRTDAGVSALGQAGLIEIDSPIPTENLPKAISDRLPAGIVVTAAEEVRRGFDIVGEVTSKLYRYTIYCGPIRPVLHIRHCWHVPTPLDVEAMHEAAQTLLGRHDFKSFASAADRRESSVRTIFRCDVTATPAEGGRWIHVETEGDGFLYNMVRNIVGTLVEVGVGRWAPERVAEALEARDRRAAGPIAPPYGLCLVWIRFD